MEYTLDDRVIRKPTHEPEAALAAALQYVCAKNGWRILGRPADPVLHSYEEFAAALLAAMPDMTLVPRVATADWTGSTRNVGIEEVIAQANARQATAEAEVARLRAALAHIQDITKPREAAMDGPHWMKNPLVGGGSAERIWRIADAALAPSEP
jgi:hypothetical protein